MFDSTTRHTKVY